MTVEAVAARVEEPAPGADAFVYVDLLTQCLDAGVLMADAAGRILHCNGSLASIFGADPEDIVRLGRDGFIDRVAALAVNPPPMVRERRLIPTAAKVACEEIEIREPRSVIRWVARAFSAPVATEIVVCTDVTTEIDLADAYQQIAVTDVLTGLANRRGIDQHLRREAARAQRHGHRLSFVMADVDHFKRVNDRWGHGAGDDVLRRVSRAISQSLLTSDVAARWGGEEFLVVLADADVEGARQCAERIRSAVDNLTIPRIGHVTISAGVAELANGEDLGAALLRADQFLYKAKGEGRNTVRG